MESKVERPWGYYRVIHTIGKTIKVKELVIEPGKSLSKQRHFKRSEIWYVVNGRCMVNEDALEPLSDAYHIPVETWLKGYNPFDEPCHIIEVQHGTECVEDDIESDTN